jgi:hypothetical protein
VGIHPLSIPREFAFVDSNTTAIAIVAWSIDPYAIVIDGTGVVENLDYVDWFPYSALTVVATPCRHSVACRRFDISTLFALAHLVAGALGRRNGDRAIPTAFATNTFAVGIVKAICGKILKGYLHFAYRLRIATAARDQQKKSGQKHRSSNRVRNGL